MTVPGLTDTQKRLLEAELAHSIAITSLDKHAVASEIVKNLKGGLEQKVVMSVASLLAHFAKGTQVSKKIVDRADLVYEVAAGL